MIQYVCDRCHTVCEKEKLTRVKFEIGDKGVEKDFCGDCISDLLFEKFDFYKWAKEINRTMKEHKIQQKDIAFMLKTHATTISHTLRTPPNNGLKSYNMERIENAIKHIIEQEDEQ